MTDTSFNDRLLIEQGAEAVAAVMGATVYVRSARRHLDRPDADVRATAVEVLDQLDGFFTALLRGEPATAARIPVARLAAVEIPAAAPRVRLAGGPRLHVDQVVEHLIAPSGRVGRMPVARLLALAPGIDDDTAVEITDEHRMTAGRSVSSIPLPERIALATSLRARQEARA